MEENSGFRKASGFSLSSPPHKLPPTFQFSSHSRCLANLPPPPGTGEQTTPFALQGLQDQSQRGCTAAHGGVPEDLRTRGCCPWGLAGPGRRPGCCGSGSAGESAPSAAPGLLEFPPVACKV
uniref:Centromere protein X n=1 Tax=Mus spicilegus TaxID=10103 RepID=A0A8C6I2Z5_MUSSI